MINNTNNNINIINQIFTNNHLSHKNLNNIYQNNNTPSNMWMQNGNIYYSPTKLDNSKNSVYYNYSKLKFNNSYQNLTNRSNNSTNTLNFNNNYYNINSSNSTTTNTISTTSFKNKNNNNNKDIDTNTKKHISQINLISNNSTITNTETKKIPVIKKTIKKISILNIESKDRFDPAEFRIIKLIGEGSFGKIYEVQWTKNNKNML